MSRVELTIRPLESVFLLFDPPPKLSHGLQCTLHSGCVCVCGGVGVGSHSGLNLRVGATCLGFFAYTA
jgi:hypothetical protein